MAYMIDIVTNPDRGQWNQYTSENRGAKFSHLAEWGESLARTYSLPLVKLAAIGTKTDRISGLLPLILFSPPGKGVRLISLPYTDMAGIIADDWESCRRLVLAALKLADSFGANHVELRQDGVLSPFFQCLERNDTWGYTPHNFKTSLLRPLTATVDTLWSGLSAKVRNQIRKAERCECLAKAGGNELLSDFYAVFSENMRDLGSPVHDRELFRAIMDDNSLQTAIICIYLCGKPAASAFVLRHHETLYNPWASSLRVYRPFCPNMLLYWSMLQYAVVNRCRWFDFGRSSPNAPTYRFKKQWGAEPLPLSWHVFSRNPYTWNPDNESLEYESWKSMDLMRSRQDGPAVRRWISL